MIPKVSVVITTFKRPWFLREAIESVLSQNFKNFELIIVNDDPAGEEIDRMISSFRDSRIVYVKNKENLGSTKSLNVGLRTAKGEYIAILDDDDVWLSKEKLSYQVRFLDENPEYVLLGTNGVIVDAASGKEITKSNYPADDKELRKMILKSNPFAHSSVMFRREIAEAVGGYDESLPRGKDYDLWLKLARVGKIAILPDCFLKYREATFAQRNLVKQRYEDAKWTLEVMKRHRRELPSTFWPYICQLLRFIVFGFLMTFPFLYKGYKRLR